MLDRILNNLPAGAIIGWGLISALFDLIPKVMLPCWLRTGLLTSGRRMCARGLSENCGHRDRTIVCRVQVPRVLYWHDRVRPKYDVLGLLHPL